MVDFSFGVKNLDRSSSIQISSATSQLFYPITFLFAVALKAFTTLKLLAVLCSVLYPLHISLEMTLFIF